MLQKDLEVRCMVRAADCCYLSLHGWFYTVFLFHARTSHPEVWCTCRIWYRLLSVDPEAFAAPCCWGRNSMLYSRDQNTEHQGAAGHEWDDRAWCQQGLMYSKRRVVSKGGHGKEQCSGKMWLRLLWSVCSGRGGSVCPTILNMW